MTSMRALSGLALGLFVFRVPFDLAHGWTALAVFLLTLGSLYALGMCLASLFLMYGREVWHVAHALEEPVYLANGLYFPIRALGPWGWAAVSTIPLAVGLDAMRQLLLGSARRSRSCRSRPRSGSWSGRFSSTSRSRSRCSAGPRTRARSAGP
jgi:ABC-2 type transport system permease protein